MSGIKVRIRDGMTEATQGDLQHIDTDFVSGAGVVDLATDCLVTQNTGSDRNILVSTGTAYIRNSASFARNNGEARYITAELEDATTTVAITPNSTLATRIDYVCLKYDSAVSPNADASNSVATIVVVAGTVNGVAPTIPSNHLVLARLDLAQNFTAVTNAMITDMRVRASLDIKDGWTLIDKSEDPLAVGGTLGIVQYVSSTQIKIYGDWRTRIGKYTKLRFTNTTEKYFLVTDDGSYAASYTTYTVDGGGLYTLANAAISKAYYSVADAPVGFPFQLDTLKANTVSDVRIINGNFDVWQRTTSVSTPDVTETFAADRWLDVLDKNGGTLPTLTRSRVALTPGDLNGSFYASRLTTNGAGTSLGTSSYHYYVQRIEHGTRYLCGASRQVTISFWARSSIGSKKLGIHLNQSYGSGGSPSATEVINGTNITLTSTLTKYTVTLTTNTLVGKTFGTNNDDSLQVVFAFVWGSSFAAREGAAGAETYVGSGTIDIARVKIDSGSVATEFRSQPSSEVLGECLRYYQKSYALGVAPGTATTDGTNFMNVGTSTTNNLAMTIQFPVRMRTSPTMTIYDVAGNLGKVYKAGANNKNYTIPWQSETSVYLSSNDATNGADLGFHWTANAEL